MPFFDTLSAEINRLGSPCCVGLDPVLESIPAKYLEKRGLGATRSMALDHPPFYREAVAGVIRDFLFDVLRSIHGIVPAVKPQLAYFERYGSAGISALEDVTHIASDMGFIVIMDGKRGDIGDTSAAYAEAYLGGATHYCDALTVAPYMGTDSLLPFVSVAVRENKGLFSLVRTTNPGSLGIQGVALNDGRQVYELAADLIRGLNGIQEHSAAWSDHGYGPVGAVVGATDPGAAIKLRALLPGAFFLVPGYGHQGGALEAVSNCFAADGTGAVVNSARAVLYPKDGDVHAAAVKFRDQIRVAWDKRRGK